MARVSHVKAARKPAGKCVRCGNQVETGQAYSHVSPGFRGRNRVLHTSCGEFKRSETTDNPKLAELWDIQDDGVTFDDCESEDDAKTRVEEVAERIREVVAMYEESAESIESGFQHETEQSQEQRDYAEQLEAWADEVENCLDSVEWPDTENRCAMFVQPEGDPEADQDCCSECGESESEHDADEDFQAALKQAQTDCQEEFDNAMGNCPL